jgi:predicted dehydrogenase|tara:strand:- start:2368 stop:3405 length:1038 start_codon:yes stop_codon:yes gene_type:complete
MKKKIQIAVVGMGLMGSQHLKAIKLSKKATLHSILDINKSSYLQAKKFKVPFYRNFRELLKKNKPDAVIVATPNQFHEKHTSQFLKAKIPVLLEKPISDSIKSAKKIINNAKKNNTQLLIGYHRRHNTIASALKKKIDSGQLGKIVSVNVMCWLYKHEDYYKEKWRTLKGGGPLGINLVHDIDLICYLLGPVKYVQSSVSNKIRKYKVEDTAIVNLIFHSGVLCTLNISDTIVAPWSYELTAGENPMYPITNQSSYYVGGTKGSIQFPNLKHWYNKEERSWWKKIFHRNESTRSSKYTLVNQIDHFCAVVSGKTKPKISGNDGLISLKIFDAILKSSKSGKKVKI